MTLYPFYALPWPTPPVALTVDPATGMPSQYQVQAYCEACNLGNKPETLLLAVETRGLAITLTGVPCPSCGQTKLKKKA